MKQEDLIKLSQSWMKRDVDMAMRYDKTLGPNAKAMFFRQGLTHSAQARRTGIFNDEYQRCAVIKDPSHSLVYLVVNSLSNKIANDNTYLIPISDSELGEAILKNGNKLVKSIFNCRLEYVQVGDDYFYCINVKFQLNDNAAREQSLFELLQHIANWGALVTQDKLIQILLQLGSLDLLNLERDQQSLAIIDDNIRINISDVIKLLEQAPLNAKLNPTDANAYEFYCAFLARFVQGFSDVSNAHKNHISLDTRLLQMQALRRLHLKLLVVQDLDSSYETCMTSLELAFDEITNLLSLIQPYSKHDLFSAIKNFMHTNLALPSHYTPTSASMAGSCMHVINRKIIASLKYLHTQNGGNDCKVFMMRDLYYEISKAQKLNQDFEHDKLFRFSGAIAKDSQNYTDQIVDLMLVHIHANVMLIKRGFAGHDVISIVENQFVLRAKENSSKQLIVILDTTMTNLSDSHVRQLLSSFEEQIRNGELAIFIITSLNKYCQIGFDRLPSGISTEFYAKEKFPLLSTDELIGFEPNDAIPQTLTHFLRHVGSSVTSYYRMIHAFSRNLHDNIVPNDLYCEKQPIHIDYPYTQDGYNRPWGFMVIRFAKSVAIECKRNFQDLLENLGIEYRGGFGFNRTAYLWFGDNLDFMRISIGPNASAETFKKIVSFIELENANINRNINKLRSKL